jgi:hypothetical protein
MAIRSTKYPLDVSTRYPETVITRLPNVRARDRLSGLTVNPDTDDLTVEVVFKSVRSVFVNTHKILAYCDVIDLAQEKAATQVAELNQRVAALGQNLVEVKGEVAAIKASVESLIAFLGVRIPAWANKEEVENGDDMGMDRLSAAELGILVTFEFERLRPGFEHEQVISIDPPAGSLITRGSTVKVTLNLQG